MEDDEEDLEESPENREKIMSLKSLAKSDRKSVRVCDTSNNLMF